MLNLREIFKMELFFSRRMLESIWFLDDGRVCNERVLNFKIKFYFLLTYLFIEFLLILY